MLAALATATILATLWMLGVVAFQTFTESGRKVAAALTGRWIVASPSVEARIAGRVSQRLRQAQALRVLPQWRAAA